MAKITGLVQTDRLTAIRLIRPVLVGLAFVGLLALQGTAGAAEVRRADGPPRHIEEGKVMARKCEECNGFGYIIETDYSTRAEKKVRCGSCGGKGEK